MNHLPIELLPFIIEQVNEKDLLSCSLVNKSFYAATIPILWRSYRDDRFGYASRLKLINCLQKTSPPLHHPMATYLQRLALDSEWDDTHFLDLFQHLSLLEELRIANGKNISTTTLQQLPKHCPHLKVLALRRFELTQPVMDAFGQHCHQLEQLDLRFCSDASLTSLFASLLTHASLKRLKIYNGYDGRCHWKEQTVIDMIRLPHLTHLEFQDGSVDLVQRILSTGAAATWPRLTRLLIDSSLGDTGDTQLIPLIQLYPRLQRLLIPASQLTDTFLDAIATALPELTHLDLTFTAAITVGGVRRLVQRCPQLIFIQLYGCAFSTLAFPEAKGNCLAYHHKEDDGHYSVCYLDKQATNEMRRGSNQSR